MTKLFVEDGRRPRNAMGVCLARSAAPLSTAVGGSTGGIGAVVADGSPLSAAADVGGSNALSILISSCAHGIESMCSCVMCTVVNVIFSILMHGRKNGASELI